MVTTIAALLGLINVGSTTAFNDVVSLALETFYGSYLLVCGLLLFRRVRGDIATPEESAASLPLGKTYVWGPWRLAGSLGIVNNIIACVYLVIVGFFSFWPVALPVTPANMNYTSLVTGSVALFSMVYYFIWARKSYQGPVVEVDLHAG